jgi:hypothetical protein
LQSLTSNRLVSAKKSMELTMPHTNQPGQKPLRDKTPVIKPSASIQQLADSVPNQLVFPAISLAFPEATLNLDTHWLLAMYAFGLRLDKNVFSRTTVRRSPKGFRFMVLLESRDILQRLSELASVSGDASGPNVNNSAGPELQLARTRFFNTALTLYNVPMAQEIPHNRRMFVQRLAVHPLQLTVQVTHLPHTTDPKNDSKFGLSGSAPTRVSAMHAALLAAAPGFPLATSSQDPLATLPPLHWSWFPVSTDWYLSTHARFIQPVDMLKKLARAVLLAVEQQLSEPSDAAGVQRPMYVERS